MRKRLTLDLNKIDTEDRKFLLTKNSTEILFEEQMITNNRIIFISISALFISIASFVLSSLYVPNDQKLGVLIVLILLWVYLFYSFIRSFFRVKIQKKIMEDQYEFLFKKHFDYSKQGNGIKDEKNC